jgi:ectoine hydroxylase-related dioxygenase (phytanoyl-CoA dioxygenase family)
MMSSAVTRKDRVLTPTERAFWEENGYVIIHNAVPQENIAAAIDAIWDFLEVDRNHPEEWYKAPVSKAGMLELYHHQALWNNRQEPKVYQAFADIWQTDELWVSFDRANMNPPARQPDWDYQGMYHWDIDTTLDPIPFMVQGVLYLADTPADGGGFHCTPGMHKRFYEWVKTQPTDRHPYLPDSTDLEIKTIPGKAGDLLIWHSLLPHGNSRNRSRKPRLAQYITMFPPRSEEERAYRSVTAARQSLPRRPTWLGTEALQRPHVDGIGGKVVGVKALVRYC